MICIKTQAIPNQVNWKGAMNGVKKVCKNLMSAMAKETGNAVFL